MNQLNELDEKHTIDLHQTTLIQQQCSKWHDRFIKKKVFYESHSDLFYDSWFKKDSKGQLRTRWLGTCKIDKVFDNGTVCFTSIDENQTPLIANGHRILLYHNLFQRMRSSLLLQLIQIVNWYRSRGFPLFLRIFKIYCNSTQKIVYK